MQPLYLIQWQFLQHPHQHIHHPPWLLPMKGMRPFYQDLFTMCGEPGLLPLFGAPQVAEAIGKLPN
jgi:hypothetical protein